MTASKKPPKAGYKAENRFMQLAVDEARIGIYNGHGGPFGSVVVKDGEVIGRGHNKVVLNNDSTAHGEISAIRDAEQRLGTFDLSGCHIYTTGEPCPMCLAACMWANIERIYYGCTIADNEEAGFRDKRFYEKLGGAAELSDYLFCTDRDACKKLFEEYAALDKTAY